MRTVLKNNLDLYIGNIAVSPFGEQVLNTKKFNECGDGTIFLFEKPKDSSSWQIIGKFPDNPNLTIDLAFSPTSTYEMRYCNNCDDHVHCIDESRESNALVAKIILKGITSYTNISCMVGAVCKIQLPIINQSPAATQSDLLGLYNVSVSDKCGKILTKLSFIQNYGLIRADKIVTSGGKVFAEYVLSSKKVPAYAASQLLNICYCTKDASNCAIFDYTIQVGSLYIRDSTKQECWSGNSCVFSVLGDLSQNNVILSQTCRINPPETDAIEVNYARFIEVYKEKNQIKTKFVIRVSTELVGLFKICVANSDVIVGEITINSFSLVPNQMFIDSYQLINFKSSELIDGTQVLLLKRDGLKISTHIYSNSVFSLQFNLSSGIYEVYWCLANKFTSCTVDNEFKMKVATIYASGISNKQSGMECVAGVNCVIDLNVVKFSKLGESFLIAQAKPFNVVAAVDKCSRASGDGPVMFLHSYNGPITIAQKNDVMLSSYKMYFVGTFPKDFRPNVYNICLFRSPDIFLIPNINIVLQGVYNNSPVLVNPGRSFNIIIRGFRLPKLIYGFLSSNDCFELSPNVLSLEMDLNPTLNYNALGLEYYIWANVNIKYVRYRFVDKLRLCLCWEGKCADKSKYIQTSVEFAMAGPKFSTDSRKFMTSKPTELVVDTGYPVIAAALIIKNRNKIVDPARTGHSKYILDHSGHIRSKERSALYPFDYDPSAEIALKSKCKFVVTATEVFDNATLYYCSGYQCESLADFNIPVLDVILEGMKFKEYIAPLDVFSITTVPMTGVTSVYDKFVIVYQELSCGSAIFHNTVVVTNTMNKLNAKDFRNMFQYTLKDLFQYDKSGVNSLSLVLYSIHSHGRLYKICYCPYLAKGRCDRAGDFTTRAGMMIPAHQAHNLCTVSEEDFKDGKIYIIDTKTDSIELGRFYIVSSSEATKFLREYFTNIHGAYALDYHVNVKELSANLKAVNSGVLSDRTDTNSGGSSSYRTVVNNERGSSLNETRRYSVNHPGVYFNQTFILLVNELNELVIRGNELDTTKLGVVNIIPSINSCALINNADLLAEYNAILYKNSSKVVFSNVLMERIGYYKLCIPFDDSKWIYAGRVIVTDYTKRVEDNAEGSCLVGSGIYIFDSKQLYYRAILRGNIMEKAIAVGIQMPEGGYFHCTAQRLASTSQDRIVLLGDLYYTIVTKDGDRWDLQNVRHNLDRPTHLQVHDDLIMISTQEEFFISNLDEPYKISPVKFDSISRYVKLKSEVIKSFSLVSMYNVNKSKDKYLVYAIIDESIINFMFYNDVLIYLRSYDDLYLPVAIHSIVKLNTILTFVGELNTGRILVLSGYSLVLGLYKEIDFVGVVVSLDCFNNNLLIGSKQIIHSKPNYFITIRKLESLSKVDFIYSIPRTLQSGQEYSFKPIIMGDYIDYITNSDVTNPNLFGLKIDEAQGFILTGKLMASGKNVIVLTGGNLFGSVTNRYEFSATCRSGFGWSDALGRCSECPIGTYRGTELVSKCLECSVVKPNSTTLYLSSIGSVDCVCNTGYYLSDQECVMCEPGRFKDSPGDAPCMQTCPVNMISNVQGASSLQELNCLCGPGLFNPTQDYYNDNFDINAMDKAYKYKCNSCPIGYYCKGGRFGPIKCPPHTTTISTDASSVESCLCLSGYEKSKDSNACVMCERTHYKDNIGNENCTLCSFEPSALDSTIAFDKNAIRGELKWYDLLLYGNKSGIIDQRECKYCISGYYYESSKCEPCPISSYCPGLSSSPISCGHNASAADLRSTDASHCVCIKSYAYNHRSPIDNSIVCRLNNIDYDEILTTPRIPLLEHMATDEMTGKLINAPGYAISKSSAKEFQDTSFSCSIPPKGPVQAWYENVVYMENFMACAGACRNLGICSGFIYVPFDLKPLTKLNSSRKDLYKMSSKCIILYYNIISEIKGFTETKAVADTFDIKDTHLDVVCAASRDVDFDIPLPCPQNHYCPQNSAPIFCPRNSITIPPGYARAISDCKCLPGYYSVKDRDNLECVPCLISYYKPHVGNDACIKCPGKLTTFSMAAASVDECGCMPGYFAKQTPQTNGLNDFECIECLEGNYCEGGIVDGFHAPAKNCPVGSEILSGVKMATNVRQCVCMKGFSFVDQTEDGEVKFSCEKCQPGTFKETHENSVCAGRCPESATSYFESVSKSQCFCQFGLHMDKGNDKGDSNQLSADNGKGNSQSGMVSNKSGSNQSGTVSDKSGRGQLDIDISKSDFGQFFGQCLRCPKGAICPGGIKSRKLGDNVAFGAHVQAYALPGFWLYIAEDSSRLFFPCSNVDSCVGGLKGCKTGSQGYLCDECTAGYFVKSYGLGCGVWRGWAYELMESVAMSVVRLYPLLLLFLPNMYAPCRIVYMSILALVFNSRGVDKKLSLPLWKMMTHSFAFPSNNAYSEMTLLILPLIGFALTAPFPEACGILLFFNYPGILLGLGQMVPCVRSLLHSGKVYIHRPSRECRLVERLLFFLVALSLTVLLYFYTYRIRFFREGIAPNSVFYWHLVTILRLVCILLVPLLRLKIEPFSHFSFTHLNLGANTAYFGIELIWMLCFFYIKPYKMHVQSEQCTELEVEGMIGNLIMASLIQASAYYDVKYIRYLPAAVIAGKLIFLIKSVLRRKRENIAIFTGEGVLMTPRQRMCVDSDVYADCFYGNGSSYHHDSCQTLQACSGRAIDFNKRTSGSGEVVVSSELEGDALIIAIIEALRDTHGTRSILSNEWLA